ncbi:MAG: hypothetical protein IT240_08525 [Bacteroidia bacterium]|nr:hypothetical protein [Bacteroidia bacterium]
MNNFKKKETKKEVPSGAESRPGRIMSALIATLDGSFLSRSIGFNNMLFGFFCFILGLAYIANSYQSENNVRRTYKIAEELKELRSEYGSLKSELMFHSNQSEVAKIAAPIGLHESKEPPFKLFAQAPETK